MASTDTIMQLALIEAVTVPFPGVDDVLKGKEGNSIRTKVTAVQKLLGLKDERKETHYSRESLLNFCWVRELCFYDQATSLVHLFRLRRVAFRSEEGTKKDEAQWSTTAQAVLDCEARAPGRTHSSKIKT